jgi:sporulation protein YlmC with PRC-barrel domain
MKKTLSKISILCTACSMLAASAWAQSASQDKPMNDQNTTTSGTMSSDQNNNRSWSTKHLSATGRMNENAVRSSRLIGAQVNDSSGQRVGQIQDTIVNPSSGRIDFALLSLNSPQNPNDNSGATPSSSEKIVPVPWSILRTRTSSQYSSSSSADQQPTFTLNVDQAKLNSAPTVDMSNLNQSEWQQRIYSYYGVTPHASMGGAETPEGEIKGEGAWKLQQGQQQETTPESQPQPQSNP